MKDVIVIGAGPAGSATARVIAEAGFDVELIEKRKPLETKICGGGIPNSLAEALSLPERVIEKRVTYEVHHFPWGEKVYPNEHVTVHREVFDNYLVSVAEKCGAQVTYETMIVNIKRERNELIVHVKTKTGEIFTTRCKVLVFADGATTMATKIFPSVGFKGNPNNTAIGAIYEVESKGNSMRHYEIYYGTHVSSWGYGWIFPKKDSLNIGVGCLLSDLKKSRQNIAHVLHQFFKKVIPHSESFQKKEKIKKFGAALIPLAPARRIFAYACLVVGDAAGMVDPLLGCGIDHGILAGNLAGQVAIGALKNRDFSEKWMSRYQTLWQQSANYWQIRKNETITKTLRPFLILDKNMISKAEYMLFFRRKSSPVENLRTLLFPIL